ncbi:hypothetical protein EDM76_08700 [bacterium]|nr:MAG: hypothetical protein EDM76_08700 [bacterium]
MSRRRRPAGPRSHQSIARARLSPGRWQGVDVYGRPTATGALPNEFDFAGQRTDPTGLQYLRARNKDPATRKFVSREPLVLAPGWTGNPFGYGAANPARMTNPVAGPCSVIAGPGDEPADRSSPVPPRRPPG